MFIIGCCAVPFLYFAFNLMFYFTGLAAVEQKELALY